MVRVKEEMWRELGKHFLNFALLIAGSVIIQPLLKGVPPAKIVIAGLVTYLVFLGIGIFFLSKGGE